MVAALAAPEVAVEEAAADAVARVVDAAGLAADAVARLVAVDAKAAQAADGRAMERVVTADAVMAAAAMAAASLSRT